MNVESDDEINDGISPWSEESTNVITVHHNICTCGKWQDHKYPCQHGMAYFQKWKNLSLKEILQKHVHPYYTMMSMKEIYRYNINPVVQDSIFSMRQQNLPF